MNQLKNVASVLIMMLFMSSCQTQTIEPQIENQQAAVDIAESNESSKIDWDTSFISVQSDLVNAVNGCYTVNVRVYITANDGTVYLVANENVQVGECGNGGRNGNSAKTKCEGSLPNGDYVVDNGTIGDKECLYDLLIENTKIYNLYLVSVDKTINGN